MSKAGLDEILPRAELIQRFGERVIFEEYRKNDLKIIAMKEPHKLFNVAATVWNRIVQKGWHRVDPRYFAADGYPFHSGTPNRLWFRDHSALADSIIDR